MGAKTGGSPDSQATSQAATAVDAVREAQRLLKRLMGDLRDTLVPRLLRLPPYRAALRRSPPDRLPLLPIPDQRGQQERGEAILTGSFVYAGQHFPLSSELWSPLGARQSWLEAMHGFDWLDDLSALPHGRGRLRARELVDGWITTQRGFHPVAWRPDIVARRFLALLHHFDFLLSPQADPMRAQILASLAEQGRFLLDAMGWLPAGDAAFTVLDGAVHALFCLDHSPVRFAKLRARVETRLAEVLRADLFPDGGHIDRSPSALLRVLDRLISIRDIARAGLGDGWPDVQLAIDRVAPLVRFFQHGDGRLALFNDSNEEDAEAIRHILAEARATGKPPRSAPHMGFERLHQGKTLLLVDVAAPPAEDRHAHAGTLSFEMSCDKDRMIVNCGATYGDPSDWRRAQRATAAHSTLTVNDVNTTPILGANRLGRRPVRVWHQRQEGEAGLWLDASHDGYRRKLGLIHTRRLFLAAGGEDVRGEDRVTGSKAQAVGLPFAIRFHLHPRAHASLIQNGAAVLIKLPSGSGWRLRCLGGEMRLADSVYLGQRGQMRRCQQIVISGILGAAPGGGVDTVVKWSLRKEGAGPQGA